MAFDKTGTLTEGTPRVAEIEPVRVTSRAVATASLSADEALALAAGAEQPSQHPIARAILAAARDRDLVVAAAQDFDSTPGRGVTAVVAGRRVRVGSPALLTHTATPHRSDAEAADAGECALDLAGRLEQAGQTAVVVLVDDLPAAVLGLADRLRPDARDTVTALTGNSPVLLTGDNPLAAARLAAEVGITDIRAGLLPGDKVDAVKASRADGHRVLLVGDGVNDAPAMAAAELAVAMGRRGSDLALETADAIIVRDELATLAMVIGLSRRARRVVAANLAFAATVIAALDIWDITATLALPLGVAGHEGSTGVVGSTDCVCSAPPPGDGPHPRGPGC